MKRERERESEWREDNKKKREEKGEEKKKKDESETADTGGEGETLPDPQGAEVPAWEQRERKEKAEIKEIERVKVSVLHGCSKHKSTRFLIFLFFI